MESKAGFFFVAHLEVAESDGRGFPPKDERLELKTPWWNFTNPKQKHMQKSQIGKKHP